jgi:hypothetical protein
MQGQSSKDAEALESRTPIHRHFTKQNVNKFIVLFALYQKLLCLAARCEALHTTCPFGLEYLHVKNMPWLVSFISWIGGQVHFLYNIWLVYRLPTTHDLGSASLNDTSPLKQDGSGALFELLHHARSLLRVPDSWFNPWIDFPWMRRCQNSSQLTPLE